MGVAFSFFFFLAQERKLLGKHNSALSLKLMLQGQVIDVGPLMNGFQVTRPPSSIGVRPRRRQHSPCARAWSSVQRAFPGWVYAALKFGESTIPKGPRNRFGNLRKAPKTNGTYLRTGKFTRC
jgi:hypothetical protein